MYLFKDIKHTIFKFIFNNVKVHYTDCFSNILNPFIVNNLYGLYLNGTILYVISIKYCFILLLFKLLNLD